MGRRSMMKNMVVILSTSSTRKARASSFLNSQPSVKARHETCLFQFFHGLILHSDCTQLQAGLQGRGILFANLLPTFGIVENNLISSVQCWWRLWLQHCN